MADLQPWATALIGVAAIFAALIVLWRILLLLSPGWYASMIKNNSVSVDDFVGGPPSAVSALKACFLNRLNVGSRVAKKEGYPLKKEDSDKVSGLKVTSRNENGSELSETAKPPVVVGTIRMGFGHHRIAYAATSWGLGGDIDNDRETWFHDFLNIESEEAQMIKDTDKLYSKGSRLASEMGGAVEKFWGSLTKSGDEDSLRLTASPKRFRATSVIPKTYRMQIFVSTSGTSTAYAVDATTTISDLKAQIENTTFVPAANLSLVNGSTLLTGGTLAGNGVSDEDTLDVSFDVMGGMRKKWKKKRMRRLRRKRRKMRQRAR